MFYVCVYIIIYTVQFEKLFLDRCGLNNAVTLWAISDPNFIKAYRAVILWKHFNRLFWSFILPKKGFILNIFSKALLVHLYIWRLSVDHIENGSNSIESGKE